MSDLIDREVAFEVLTDYYHHRTYIQKLALKEGLSRVPSAEPEIITIEELSNQLGCATIQSALYWFEFLKTLDLLGFAIIRKETK